MFPGLPNPLHELTFEHAGWLIAALILIFWLLGTFRRWLKTALERRRMRLRQRRAQRGEHDARALLKSHGFQLLDSQVQHTWTIHVDDQPVEITLIADHIVQRKRKRFVAEVKTGSAAPSIRTASTRRQLLEYSVAFDCDGVLLVDMEARTVHEIHFFDR